jgi:hypothetical protein
MLMVKFSTRRSGDVAGLLEELHRFILAVWALSSDISVFYMKQGDLVSTRISNAFLNILGNA